jgi:hypothetical protein
MHQLCWNCNSLVSQYHRFWISKKFSSTAVCQNHCKLYDHNWSSQSWTWLRPKGYLHPRLESFYHSNRGAQVSISKFLSDFPTHGSKLSSFLDNCVEERKYQKQITELIALYL